MPEVRKCERGRIESEGGEMSHQSGGSVEESKVLKEGEGRLVLKGFATIGEDDSTACEQRR